MRETRNDTAQAIVLALLLHVVPLLVLLLASLWRTPPQSAAGEPVSADVVDINALSASMRSALRATPEPPAVPPPEPVPEPLEEALPEPLPEDTAPPASPPEPQPVPQEQLPDPDERDQEEVRPDATAAEAAAREQEAKQRQAQVDLTEERERQRKLQELQRARNAMLAERERQIADLRRQRADARREAELAEQRLLQLAERRAREASAATAAASPPPGNRGTDPNLKARYAAALQAAILANFTRPDNVPLGQRCKVVIRQIKGGEVLKVEADPSCPYDEAARRLVEAAVFKADPLPYAGFESVFEREITLNFVPQDN